MTRRRRSSHVEHADVSMGRTVLLLAIVALVVVTAVAVALVAPEVQEALR